MNSKKIKRRDPVARDLLSVKYRQRVVPNKKRAAKSLICLKKIIEENA